MVDTLLILAYHRVGFPDPGARYRGQFVTPEHLRNQVKWLKSLNYELLTLSAALNRGGRRAVLTFDDGYRNNLSLGLPVLRELRVPATVFVVTGDVGRSNVVWSEAGETNPSDLMSWEEIRQLRAHGWEIGSHCSEHVHLSRRSNEEQRRLIEASFVTLTSQVAIAHPPVFAYPYGSLTSETAALVRAAGFSSAVTTAHGVNDLTADPFQLKRVAMRGYRWDHYVRAPVRLLAPGLMHN